MSATWAIVVGVLLIVMAITGSVLQRLPLSAAMIYLAVGFGIGPEGLNLLHPDLDKNSDLLENIAEIGLLISLFSAGLKLRLPLKDARWRLAFRLAVWGLLISVALTIPLIMWCGFSFGFALLLAAAISPTDPVLAADVQVEDAVDRDRLRFSLTGESGLNDGIALPLVALSLGFIASETDAAVAAPSLLHWLAVECLWSLTGGILVGVLCGFLISQIVLYLRTRQKEALGLDEFLVLGSIALAYGMSSLIHTSPFLAVLFAGLSMGHTAEDPTKAIPSCPIEKLDELASTPEHAAPLMMRALRGFNEQLERIVEVAIVLLIGAMLSSIHVSIASLLICVFTFCIARPISVYVALLGAAEVTAPQRRLMAWFGVRGVGSIYYAFYALNHGVPEQWRSFFLSTILLICASSIVAHGISVTPLMNHYRKNTRKSDRA